MYMASAEYVFKADEKPAMAGTPYKPKLSPARRAIYFVVGLFLGTCTTLCNGLVASNIGVISGSIGEYTAQVSWLVAIFLAINASANLTLVKARMQFGIPLVTASIVGTYIAACVLQLLWPTLTTAVIATAINGMMCATLIALSTYYLMQALAPSAQPMALIISVGLTQIGSPVARMIPVEFLASQHWLGLHLLNLGIGMAVLGVTLAAPLPRSERVRVFSPSDGVVIVLLVSSFLLFAGVLGLGRSYWWTDAPFLGWMLVAAISLLVTVVFIERRRRQPLLQLEWLGSFDLMRFVAIALLVRLSLAEQTFGSVGLLSIGGLNNDQLRVLFACVLVSMLMGIVVACLTLSPKRIPWQVMVAALFIATGAYLDSQSTSFTRAPQLYLSQCLIGFGATLFIGPALIFGFLKLFTKGPQYMVTLVVLYGASQSIGGLAGSAVMGSYEFIRTQSYTSSLADSTPLTNPLVVTRLGIGEASLSSHITDPEQRQQQGSKLLGQALQQQASVLAFNDVFCIVSVLAFGTALYVLYLQMSAFFLSRIRREPEIVND